MPPCIYSSSYRAEPLPCKPLPCIVLTHNQMQRRSVREEIEQIFSDNQN